MKNSSKTSKAKIKVNSLNRKIKNDVEKFVLQSENSYKTKINFIARKVSQSSKVKLLFVAGPSASGKTTTSHLIKARLAYLGIHATVVSLDDFFCDVNEYLKTHDTIDYESPERIDVDLFKKTMNELLTNKLAYFPKFNFKLRKPEEKRRKMVFNEGDVLIIEGIHALNPILYDDLIKKNCIKIYVCPNRNFTLNGKVCLTSNNLRLVRRMIRDNLTRGFKPEETVNMWDSVNAGTNKFVKPFKKQARYVIDTVHDYEPFLYKSIIWKELENLQGDARINAIKKAFMQCNFEIGQDLVPEDSLINEFIGKENF